MKRTRVRRGATLVLVTTIGAIVSILAFSMMELAYDARMLAARDVDATSARCAADAALAEASYRMQRKLAREGSAWTPISPGSGTLPGTHVQYSYNCEVVTPGSEYRINATGTCGVVNKTTHTTLGVNSCWEGISTLGAVNISNAAVLGAIGPGSDKGLKICSNATAPNSMSFTSGVTVRGDVLCGPPGDPDAVIVTASGARIEGTKAANTDWMNFSNVAIPTPTGWSWTDWGAWTVTNTDPLNVPGGVHYTYTNLTVSNAAHVYVYPDTMHNPPRPTVIYVSNTLTLENASEIRVMAGASLELYVGRKLDCHNATGIGNAPGNSPKALRILGLPRCTIMNLQNASNSAAVIYAPEAALTMSNAGVFYGAVVAGSFTMSHPGIFYFDTSLKNGVIGDPQAKFTVSHWWED
jgi:Tfp pilus assembly protein PilX